MLKIGPVVAAHYAQRSDALDGLPARCIRLGDQGFEWGSYGGSAPEELMSASVSVQRRKRVLHIATVLLREAGAQEGIPAQVPVIIVA